MMKKLCDYKLIELLNVQSVLANTSFSISKIFDAIAAKIMTEYHVKKGDVYYEFLEIELYYFDENHQDSITYPRSLEEGRWFFHSSGVDISFKSVCEEGFSTKNDPKENFFGGILIRSLLKRDKDKTCEITGPLKCCWELFDHFNAFLTSPAEYPIIEPRVPSDKLDIYKTARHFGANIKNPNHHSSLYRYFIKHPIWVDCKKSKYKALPWLLEFEKVHV